MSTPCADRDVSLQALLDGELDASHALEAEAHLKTCSGCAAYFNTLQALRVRLAETDLAPRAPPRLHAGIDAMLAAEDRAAAPRRRWWTGAAAGWSAAGAMATAAAALLVIQIAPPPSAGRGARDLEAQLVSNHVRSTLANHLIDIETSDRHVVKPWFNGRIDYAPPVPDLIAQGFPLAGGRLDYAENRVIAAVVYRRRAHVINLFILPETVPPNTARPGAAPSNPKSPNPARSAPTFEAKRDSYSVVRWSEGGLDFWAVSDIDAPDLEAFRQAFIAAAPP